MATRTTPCADDGQAPATRLPTLESGDHLTAAEFHARYEQRPNLHKAELIERVVYVASPTLPHHGQPHRRLSGVLATYLDAHPEMRGDSESTIRTDDEAEVKPDLLLRIPRSQAKDAREAD